MLQVGVGANTPGAQITFNFMEQKSDLPVCSHTVALEAKNITTGGAGSCYFQRARLLLTAR
ncbi:hypothetical protein [Vitiosangium sp. GDMCC 1.1324]|uniref:hypothetical protein n=1 Tax=Vitiosangium sp. (strain GDMCC 1.1324) TaxID=2138576 RepID=UPI000D3D0073|nr:hypothetical protein [Vitiosangium sp. GDMCC 1.1324]PTL78818.1 hypothetical protein DAT35_37810 [Vitiosangium sp. GDMCC 1.1324]